MDNNQVANVIQAIADKLGVAAVHLWPEMVRYTWAHAMFTLVSVLTWIVLAIVSVPINLRYCINNWGASDYDSGLAFSIVVRIMVMLVFGFGAVFGATSINDSISRIIAPEGATVMQMLKAASGK